LNVKNIIGFAIGPIGTALLGVLTVPVIAWAFSPEDVGRLALLQLVLSFSMLVLGLGLDQAYVREFHESRDRARLLKISFTPGFILLSIVASVTIWRGDALSKWIFGDLNYWYYSITIICIVATYISRFLSLILRMNGRGLAFSMSQIIPKALQLLLLVGVVLLDFQKSFLALLLIVMGSALVVALVCAWNTRSQWILAISAQASVREIRSLLHFGLPLVVSGLAYWGLTATSALVLRSESTLGELGIYSVVSSFAAAAAIFQSIFSVIWAPTVYKWVANGVDLKRVDEVARQALAAVCLIFCMIGSLSWLTDYLLPKHYSNIKYLLLCAIIPPLLYVLSEITSIGIGISRRTTLAIWVTLAALIVNVLLSLWLVPANGATGAVLANAAAYTVYFIGRTEASAYVWRQFRRRRLYAVVGLILFSAISTVVYSAALPAGFAFVWVILLLVSVWYFYAEFFGIYCMIIGNR
jgi:O-antigen/teichoic acid export membrane protein